MKTNIGHFLLAIGLGYVAACDDSSASSEPSENAGKAGDDGTTAVVEAGGKGAAGEKASASTGGAGDTATKPAETTEPSQPVPQPTAAGSAATTGTKPLFPDACAERRGSWSKPCTENPDPCGLNSGYPGDEYCLLPPPEGKGIQIHFGPKDYKNAEEVAPYVLKPGDEYNSYAIVNVPTTEDHYYNYVKISMRPGSHHLINNLMAGEHAEGFLDGRAGCDGEMLGSFPGTQNLILESPPQGIPAPENVGLGRSLPGNASLCQNYHRYNNTDKPALSEIWYNIWFVDEKDITQKASGVNVTAGPWKGIPPHTRQLLTTTTEVKGDGRIISLFGHRHAATERFAVWHNDALIYDSWDWVESRLFNYDSITQNPAPNPPGQTDGATSGVIDVKQGDKIKIECHVNNTTDNTLKFANELYTGEMCILFGSTVGVGIN
ncbi:MAG: hypothetical protein RL701_6810 [Pseudomonadota bacterium]